MSNDNYDLFGDDSLTADLLDHLDDISDEARLKWPRDLVALLNIFQAALERQNVQSTVATKVAHALIGALATYCGGRYLYIPKDDALQKAIRDVNLYQDWCNNSLTPEELRAKYKISLQHVYRVIKEQRGWHINKIQPKLT